MPSENNFSHVLTDPHRLEKLRALCLLDTPTNPAFDRLTRVAAQILNTPTALVTLIDVDRQVFKSHVGLGEPWATLGETPLSHSFCKHTILANTPLVIDDARIHSVVWDNPAIRDMGVIAYLGIPLITADGQALGSLCVVEQQPRQWTTQEIQLLEDLAASVMTEIELQGELLERAKVEAALRESEALYRQTLDAIQDLVVVRGPQSRIRWANKAFCEYYGMSQEALYGMVDAPFVDAAYTEQYMLDDQQVFQNGQSLNIPKEPITRHDGTVRKFNTIKTPIFNDQNEVILSVGVSRDITDQEEREEELRFTLVKEIELNSLKSQFASMASHEFRTPLAVILASKGILERFEHKLAPEKKQYHFNMIEQQVRLLVSLLEDMLALSTAETVSMEANLEVQDLTAYCQDIITEIASTTNHHSIGFVVTGTPVTTAFDAKLMRQALTNLLSNAIKYSPEGGVIQFELGYEINQVQMCVEDAGIGIPEADQAQLFEVFHRAVNVGAIAGTGLGLAIVKRAVEAHGGTIQVESTLDVGTRFVLTFPNYNRPSQ